MEFMRVRNNTTLNECYNNHVMKMFLGWNAENESKHQNMSRRVFVLAIGFPICCKLIHKRHENNKQ